VLGRRLEDAVLAYEGPTQRADSTQKRTYGICASACQRHGLRRRRRKGAKMPDDSEQRGRELMVLWGHQRGVYSVAYSSDGSRIVTGGHDGTWRAWDAGDGTEIWVVWGHQGSIYSVAYSPDGSRVVSGGHDGTGRVWDAVEWKEIMVLRGHQEPVDSVAYSPDGSRIVTGSRDGTVRIWDGVEGRELLFFPASLGLGRQAGRRLPIGSARYSPDQSRIAFGSGEGLVHVCDPVSGQQVLLFRAHDGPVSAVAYSPEGTRLVTASFERKRLWQDIWNGTAKVWDAVDGSPLRVLEAAGWGRVFDAAYSPDGQRVVAAAEDHTARVWAAGDGRELLTLRGHGDCVDGAAFSPDGERVVTGSLDGTARVWEV
jgi:WD40 repeat protein